MQYCNDCFAKMDDKALHCKACQSRDLRHFETLVAEETQEGIVQEETKLQKPEPRYKVDRQYLVEPKPKESDLPPKNLLYFPSDAKAQKKLQKKINKNRRSALGRKISCKGSRTFGAAAALFVPLLVAIAFIGYIGFNVLPDHIKQQIAAAVDFTPTRPLPMVEVTTKGKYAWSFKVEGKPVLWDSCRPIYWVDNPDNAPEVAHEILQEAFDEVSSLTGLQFIYAGETSETFDANRKFDNTVGYENVPGDWAPVLVTYLSKDAFTDAVIESGDWKPREVAAFAGPNSIEKYGDWVYVSGAMTVSSESLRETLFNSGRNEARTLFIHELGHVVGLDHVSDQRELMDPGAYPETAGPGDKKGFALAGQGMCRAEGDYPNAYGIDWSSYGK